MTEPLRIVLGGLGVRGAYWADVINRSPRCELVAYADPNPAARQRACGRFGERPAYESVEAALAKHPGVQAVVLANPPIGREGQVRAAVERGIPMLIEKPLALSLREAAHLVQIAELANVPLMVGLNFRYLAVTKAIMELLSKEVVGRAEFARFTYERWRDGYRPDLNKYPLTMDQPMLWEQSIHHFDLLRYVYGQEPLTVQCQTWNPSWSMYASHANVAALFTFDRGMVVNYQGTWQSNWAVPHFEWRTECSGGVISQREQFGELHYARKTDPELTEVPLPPHEIWVTETIGLLDGFIGAVVDGLPLPCSGRDHLRSLAMLEACVISSKEGRRVEIADVLHEAGGA